MPVETHIIRVADNATPSHVEGILRSLIGIGGKVELVVQKSIIATFNSDHINLIRQKQSVLLVGAINFSGRKVRKVVKCSPE
ncbi:MAG: hypothetical protein Q8J68_03520 [Methanolobus sp.]|uniref:hypothetical protein n=1 Tax=Methanolobus sp. TaxID=1874737 RepID=UPI002731B50E|nr:hypothetical protein [Methanolobus sp.]MDP2216339.1 hypothetical protein [Methanolobus sp.]